MMNRGLSFSTAAVFFLLLTGNLFGEDLNGEEFLQDWFSDSGESGRYTTIEDDLYPIFRLADNSGVPPALLMEKLREGAAKGIPGGRLLSALRSELERLISAGDILDGSGYFADVGSSETQNAYKIIAIMLREDIPEEKIRQLLEKGRERNLPLTAATAACSAVFQVSSVTDLRENELLRLGTSLYDSDLGPSNYDAVVSIFVRGRVNRLEDEEILDIIEDVFTRGGGLIRLERELNKRTRR